MIRFPFNRAAIAITLAGSLLCTGHALAEPQSADAVSVRVDLSDLDLRSGPGLNQAMSRIEAAAVQVCGGRPDIRRLDDVQAYNECHGVSMAGAKEHLQTVAAAGGKAKFTLAAVR